MALRFAIIRSSKTRVGQNWEDVIYEIDEAEIVESLSLFLEKRLLEKRSSRWLKTKWSISEIKQAFGHAFSDVIEDFKRITIKIL